MNTQRVMRVYKVDLDVFGDLMDVIASIKRVTVCLDVKDVLLLLSFLFFPFRLPVFQSRLQALV